MLYRFMRKLLGFIALGSYCLVGSGLWTGCHGAHSSSADRRQLSGTVRAPSPARLELIQVAPDGRGFVQVPSGKPFTPWGFNYDRDYKSRLLEDYWVSEWRTVVEDFREMKHLGANVVRVHLQFARFMDTATKPNPQSLAQLARLVRLAEATGLYLDLTGLGCYRRNDVPAWYATLNESDRWAAQARFWGAVANTCAASPAVFCYDLANEPIVPSGKREPGDWLTGDLAGFTYCQFISLDQAGRARPELARQWLSQLAGAIRRRDRRHLITAGLLPNSLETPVSVSGFAPQKVGGPLDFLCVHLYPVSGHLKPDLELLHGFNVGKPVVIEEMFPLTCTVTELGDFLRASKPDACGWFGFYWGQPPDELDRSSDAGAKLTAEWLRLFQRLNPN